MADLEQAYWFRDFTKDQRDAAASSGAALPDGSFPIQNESDLENAVKLAGHASNPAAAKAHIKKRAAALGATGKLPEGWSEPSGSDVHVDVPIGSLGRPRRQRTVKMRQKQVYDDTTGVWGPVTDSGDEIEVLLEKTDVNYRMAAAGATELCGNCRFFDADCLECNLVEGTISSACVCNLWKAQIPDMSALGPNGYREPTYQVFVEAARVFTAGDFSKPGWIPFLPKPGRYQHAAYGEIIITPGSNQELVDSVKNHVYQEHIPIDAEHETKLSGAVAWLTDMRMNADGSADAFVEFTDRGQALLSAGAYKYVSPEFWPEWRDPASGVIHRNIVAGGAITTRPFFKERVLRALVASESGVEWLKSDKEDKVPDDPKTTAAGEPPKVDPKEESKTDPAKEPVKAAETKTEPPKAEAPKTFTEDQLKEQVAAAVAKAKTETAETYSDQLKVVADEAKASTAALAVMQKTDRQRRFTDLVAGKGGENDGGPWVGDPTKHVAHLEALSEKFGETDPVFIGYVEQQSGIAAQVKDSDLFKELGTSAAPATAGDPDSKLDAIAKGIMAKDPAKTYAQAYNEGLSTPEGQKIYASKPVRGS